MPCGKLRIRYELLRSLRMRYVSLRNVRIVADGLYVSSAESVSVCVTGALDTVKPVLSGHSKIDKTKILMTNGSLMKVESCRMLPLEHSAILLTCIKQ